MLHSPLFKKLIDSLCQLPGVGPRSAQRMALQLLDNKREAGLELAAALQEAMQQIGRCSQCRVYTEQPICEICSSSRRDNGLLCVVETPADVLAIEQSNEFFGKYFVLSGNLSPLDGRGPVEIGVPDLVERVISSDISEVILATGTTVEGEATAFYISEQLADKDVTVSRIAHGVPLGGGLEYVDGGTLARALSARSNLNRAVADD